MADTIVLYPFPTTGHLLPMVELAKLFTAQNFDVAIVLMDTPHKLAAADEIIVKVTTKYPSISFHHLAPHGVVVDEPNTMFALFQQAPHNNPNLKTFLSSHSKVCTLRGIVFDLFCSDALDVATELALPSYCFFSSGAYVLATFIYVPTIDETVDRSIKEMGREKLEIPGLPPFPASHLPFELLNRETEDYKMLLGHYRRLAKVNGILVNTVEELEPRAVQALRDGLCTPGRTTPPVYCIGPLISDRKIQSNECLTWLDSQPRNSVVFLCFGSMGSFKVEQLKEIADGVERSQQRFLWVVRAPPIDEKFKSMKHLKVEPALEAMLPPGFLERTKDRGLVVKKWAPQTAVLAHEAVGGFVTHCGWNSMLESIVNGVPMIGWPLHAEQKLNVSFYVDELKLGEVMEGFEGMVGSDEVEAKVRWLLASDGGAEVRERVSWAKRSAAEATSDGGSSHRAFLGFVKGLLS